MWKTIDTMMQALRQSNWEHLSFCKIFPELQWNSSKHQRDITSTSSLSQITWSCSYGKWKTLLFALYSVLSYKEYEHFIKKIRKSTSVSSSWFRIFRRIEVDVVPRKVHFLESPMTNFKSRKLSTGCASKKKLPVDASFFLTKAKSMISSVHSTQKS